MADYKFKKGETYLAHHVFSDVPVRFTVARRWTKTLWLMDVNGQTRGYRIFNLTPGDGIVEAVKDDVFGNISALDIA